MKLNQFLELVEETNPEIKNISKSLKRDPLFRVGKEIQYQRRRAGFTQEELASKVGTSQSAIAKIESGQRNSSVHLLQKVANALKCDLNIKLCSNIEVTFEQTEKVAGYYEDVSFPILTPQQELSYSLSAVSAS